VHTVRFLYQRTPLIIPTVYIYTSYLRVRDVFNHSVTVSLKKKVQFTFYIQSASTMKLPQTKEPTNNSFTVVFGF
jgi:hypothetical protein